MVLCLSEIDKTEAVIENSILGCLDIYKGCSTYNDFEIRQGHIQLHTLKRIEKRTPKPPTVNMKSCCM